MVQRQATLADFCIDYKDLLMSEVHYHLPGLFEFYEFYCEFLPLWCQHRDWFYDWCDIASIYGAPEGSLWGGGRTSFGIAGARDILKLTEKYDISARLPSAIPY